MGVGVDWWVPEWGSLPALVYESSFFLLGYSRKAAAGNNLLYNYLKLLPCSTMLLAVAKTKISKLVNSLVMIV